MKSLKTVKAGISSMKKLYGRHSFGYEYINDYLTIRCDKIYHRVCKKGVVGSVKKKVFGGNNYLVTPVEPVNLPKFVSRHLFIEFKEPVKIEPGSVSRVYVKFPVEIGVFVEGKNTSLLDIFSLTKPKYALYGNPNRGIVCKYFVSEVYDTIPEINGIESGVMELELENVSDEWVEVTKAVFDSSGMKIYYDKFPCMTAKMRVESKTFAETSFIDKPLSSNMQKSVELYSPRMFVERGKFLMEWGV